MSCPLTSRDTPRVTKILSAHVGFGPAAGGAAERFYAMATHLLRAGEDVRLLVTDKWFANGRAPATHPFPSQRVTTLPLLNDRYDVPFPLQRRVDEAVREADVIHVIGHLAPIASLLHRAARRYRKPCVVCVAGILPLRGRSLLLKQIAQRLYGSALLRSARRVIAITDEEQRLLRACVDDPARVVVIPNAIEPIALHSATGSSPTPYVLYLGGFHPTKGPDLLVQAFARASPTLADARLVMAGAYDDLRPPIEALATRLGIRDRIDFPGWLSEEEKANALAGASFVVIPSRLDAMTIVVLEAAAMGKPVLLTRECGFPQLAAAGGGRMVEASVDGLTRGFEEMHAARADWGAMGVRNRELAAQYAWPAITLQYQRLFADVLAETTRA